MGTEACNDERNGNEWRQAAAGGRTEWLAGLMFCYNMPEPPSEDSAEAEASAADQRHADALMRYYNG